jgi:outer membrane protein OmpA-like peptidoglycan-associated protein
MKGSLSNCLLGCGVLAFLAVPSVAAAQSYRAVVNSNEDGAIAADSGLTLREAIALVNGQLPVEDLSAAERESVERLSGETPSRIEFNLPPDRTAIRLQEMLPPLAAPGLVVDGTTQPGYDITGSATAEIAIPIPVVAIAPAPGRQILRGLTVVADDVTVRGLSLYGFKAVEEATLSTPPADIFIAHRNPPLEITADIPPAEFPFPESDVPPTGVVVELNWLGIPPDESVPEERSAFGVSVFNARNAIVRRNRIQHHEGSAIITSVRANELLVTENIIVGNGVAGMPDAIRLEGIVEGAEIAGNLICGNDGSGAYLFKPEGAVQIRDNQIKFNGRRLRRAAVYLMGSDHQVSGNEIAYQAGPGVVVTAYPDSDGNRIEANRFAGLEGLSIDLNTSDNVASIYFQVGDGPNPLRNSPNRRKETGNDAIDTPRFVSEEFFMGGSGVTLIGEADPGSTVAVYRVREANATPYGPLNEAIGEVTVSETGQFAVTLDGLQPGDRVSAIATHPNYGTSEPALNATIQPITGRVEPNPEPLVPVTPQCLSQVPPPEPEPEPAPEPEPEPLILRIPRRVHFALDRATISPESAALLDEIAAALREYPFLTVELVGHTDPRASDAYNQELGRRRALAVRNYLLDSGIAPERLTIRSAGEMQRRTTGSDRIDYARDRRVEFIFQDTRGLDIIFEEPEADLQIESRGGTQ